MKNSMHHVSDFRHQWILLVLIVVLHIGCSEESVEEQSIASPNKELVFNFQVDKQNHLSYSVDFRSTRIINQSVLGFDSINVAQDDILIASVTTRHVEDSWSPVYGERNEYPDIYNELLLKMNEEVGFNIRIRAYDEGVAFRYEFTGYRDSVQFKYENTEFALEKDTRVWVSNRAQSEIVESSITEIAEAVERPLLAQLDDTLFLALGEAALVDFARMKFVRGENPGTLKADLDGPVITNTPSNSPWRYIMVATTPGELLENNYFILNLNEPSEIKNTSWIKPGKVIRETTLTTRGGLACVDFAEKHNLQFIEFDAGWYGPEYEDASDATTVTVDPKRSDGPLDLPKVVKYAKDKGIGVILYVNRRALEKQLDEILPLFRSWGISGVKYGFVNVGSQEWTSWLHEAVRKAADNQLMIDIHDEYRPTGNSRTYPNLMTQEGIRGDEESPTNSMVLKTLFTRMIAGAGDHTNCYFAARVDETMGSHASQLAKAICIYSPWQFLYWYDRPEGSDPNQAGAGQTKRFIVEVPELAFYDAIPTVWDDTKVLSGYPGEYAVVARRSGDDWFVGALNGDAPRTIEVPLDFLEGSYQATIYADDESVDTITKVAISEQEVDQNDVLKFEVGASNGVAILLIKNAN
ncbi:MAG: glycoside hydrolase family 97 N-terminal domain-containing protein [Bacteroidota bacterium]